MKKLSCTTSLLALAIAGYSGSAVSQQTCQNEIQQLRSENQQRQVPESERERVRQMLDRAARADATSCQQFVADARDQMQRAQGQSQVRSTTSQPLPARSGAQTQQQSRAQTQQQSPAQTRQQSGDQTQQQSRAQTQQQQPAPRQNRQQATTQQTQTQPSGLAQRRQDTKMEVQIEQMPATVEVDAGAPRVVVRQQPPKVTVEQQPPLVEITQPEAQVNVTQAEPKVTVNQANPQVDIQQSEPQVQVMQAGEPQVRMVGRETEQSNGQASSTRQQPATASTGLQQGERQGLVTTGQISSEEASQLEGKNVLSSQGEEVGEISEIVRSRTNNELHAVVDVGGFLGIGARSVAIPVQRGEIGEDGNLQVPLSREQLEQLPEFDDRQYEEGDR